MGYRYLLLLLVINEGIFYESTHLRIIVLPVIVR